MSSASSELLSTILTKIRPVITNNRAQLLAAASIIILTPLARYTYLDYKAWYSLGLSGVPHNFPGYLIQVCLRLFAKERFSLDYFDDSKVIARAGKHGDNTYLKREGIPHRGSPRPTVPNYTVSQRQLDQNPPEEMREVPLSTSSPCVFDIYTFAHTSNQELLLHKGHYSLSTQELSQVQQPSSTRHLKMTTRSQPHKPASSVKGEIVHIHDADGSLHVSLAPKDAKLVVELGWGERHPLVRGFHAGYMMIYGPRDEEELAVVKKIIDAGTKFMCGEPGYNSET
ncbi:hypothetical protein F5884DRAFT_904913 [Xylogone sp. PMI_703]|nr:hypothetical protein F5884DRAFT_904913 [Xylogone sp. PMI_703]